MSSEDESIAYKLRISEPARPFSVYDKSPTVETSEHELESDEEFGHNRLVEHAKRHRTLYISIGCVALGIGIAVLAGRIMKNFNSRGIPVTTDCGIPVVGSRASFFDITQGGAFMSQNKAAEIMNLSPAEISRHLNGTLDNVRGFHFERICMAA